MEIPNDFYTLQSMTGLNHYRLPSLDALMAFEAAAQLETFDLAAESLSVSSSALRKRISGLEQLLGVSLFSRVGGTLVLTAHGQAYLEQITPVLEQLLAIPMHSRLVQRKQRLIICCPPTFARQILIPRLAEHSKAYPTIDLQIQLSAPLARGTSGTWDINITGDGSKVIAEQRLLDERLYPLAAPALLAQFSTDDLSRLPLLRSSLEPWRPWFHLARLNLPEPDAGPALLDLGLMLEAAASGQGVVLARPSLAQSWLADGRLVPLSSIGSVPSYHYEVSVQHPSAAAGAFVTWLKTVCSEAVTNARTQLDDIQQRK
ncbi:LysR substrate-binding domain-containing protein [Pseudomonas sp. NPDC089996]|uniref:LysR substrate-binding domain-containing protein n=1 Tax=Pseudomonas sp. NPDC089996 TaxID=3364474 RepID=UPI00380A7D07